jgi:hypothetical protein
VDQVEDVVDVIVDAVAPVFGAADAAGQLAELAREQRKCAERIAEYQVVDVDQNDAVGIVLKDLPHVHVPIGGMHNHVVEQHEVASGSRPEPGKVQVSHGLTRGGPRRVLAGVRRR